MLIPSGRRPAQSAHWGLLFAMAVGSGAGPAAAFVFLDTSGPGHVVPIDSTVPKDSLKPAPEMRPGGIPPAPAAAGEPGPSVHPASFAPKAGASARTVDHFGNVLFLSADSKLVYAYLGVLKALDEFGLEPDAVLAESKAVFIGAAWALGYSAADLEKELAHRPLERYLRPYRDRDPDLQRGFLPAAPDPLQWDIPLGLQSLQSSGANWSDVTVGASGEYLELAWMAAKLTHDGPAGPVADLSESPRKLAVQVTDLGSEKEAVITEGSLQNIVKASLLPAEVVHQRQRLWPFVSGSLLSGHTVMAEKLPFTCDRLILVEPGRRLRPPALESAAVPWTDSLQLRAHRQVPASQGGDLESGGESGKVMVIELEPEGEFDPEETDPARWIRLGYTSALRSMDILQSVLAARKKAPVVPDSTESGAGEKEKLGLNRLSVNPLASGGRQLLLDILRISEGDDDDSSGESAIAALEQSGYYTDLDLEWARGSRDEKASLIFDAKEKSKISFRAGYNLTYTGEELTDRGPEAYAGLAWSEPFYIPFEGEVGALLGGHKPGYEARAMIAPVFPLHLELGLTRTHWDMLYSYTAPDPVQDLGALPFRLGRTLSEVFLKVFPMNSAYLRTSIQKHEMDRPNLFDEGEPAYLSTDFEETAFLGLGKRDAGGFFPHALRLRYRNLNRVNTIGQVRYATSSLESRLRVSLGDFRITDQYFWSDQAHEASTLYDLYEAGEIQAFTFQDEYFLSYLRSPEFQDVKIEYAPSFGKAGIRLIAGAYRNYGRVLFPGQAEYLSYDHRDIPYHAHWEAQAGYATPLGNLRVGLAGLDDGKPFYFIRLGSGFELGFDKAE